MRRYVIYAIELAVLAYVVFAITLFPKWTVDDAFIGFRYAGNLAEHRQLTWNPGQSPIEGYTGVALILLVAAGTKLGVSPVVSSQVIGLVSLVAGGLVLYRFLVRLAVMRPVRSVVLALYFTAPFFLPNALSGLETVLFSTVTLASVFMLYVRVARTGRASGVRDRFVRPLAARWARAAGRRSARRSFAHRPPSGEAP